MFPVETEQRIPVPHAGEQAPDQEAGEEAQAAEVEPVADVPQHNQQPEEAEVPAGQGEEGQHHAGHHNERVHHLLVPLLHHGAAAAVLGQLLADRGHAVQRVPLAGLRQQLTQPHHLRHAEQRLSKAVPGDPVLPLRQPQPHDEGGVLPLAVRQPQPPRVGEVHPGRRGGCGVHRGGRRAD